MSRPIAALALALLAAACSSVGDTVTVAVTTTAPSTSDPSPTTIETTPPTTAATVQTTSSSSPPSTTTTTAPPPEPDERSLPTDATSFATEISDVELELRDPAVADAARLAALGRRQQQLYRLLTTHPEWFDDAAGTVDPAVLPAVTANWEARRQLSAHVSSGTLATTVPAWRIVEPLPMDELLGYYGEAEAATGVPWHVLAAINLVETRLGRIEGLSTAGAVGPMQFLPSTWDWCCEGDPTDPREAILGAATYLTISGAADDLPSAVFAYNRSQRYVDAVLAYSSVMAENELAFRGYHAWDVYYLSAAGLLRLEPGYLEAEPVDAAAWVRAHPDALVGLVDP